MKGKRISAWTLSMALLAGMLPGTAFADEVGPPCENHPVHVGCSYVEGSACGHTEHTMECCASGLICGSKDAVQTATGSDAAHEHKQDCYALDCPHERREHDGCGYVEARPCDHACELCAPQDNGTQGGSTGQNVQKTLGAGLPRKDYTLQKLRKNSQQDEDAGFAIENGVLTGYVGVGNVVTIPNTVTAIGDSAFLNKSITTVTIPSSVTSIGSYAFSGCASLTEIIVPADVDSVGSGAFSGCTSLDNVIWHSSARIPDNAFTDCPSLTNLELSSEIPSIGAEGFKNCESLASITIPLKVSLIGAYAFDGCISMTAINVDSGNTSYNSYDGMLYNSSGTSLYRCPQGSRSAAIHAGTQTIESNAFYGCKLDTLNIPVGVSRIAQNAFTGSEIQKLVLPSSVTSFEQQTFVVDTIEVAEDSPILEDLIQTYGEIVKTPSANDVVYNVIEGSNGTYSGSGIYVVRVDGEYRKFINVKLDNSLVASSEYESKQGSTIITFKESYMKSLSAGEHTLQVNFTDGSATTKLQVAAANINVNNAGNSGGDWDHDSGDDGVSESKSSAATGLPSYVLKGGQWIQNAAGHWLYSNGRIFTNEWAAIQNPYADSAKGQPLFGWFHFGPDSTMTTGWYIDEAGDTYYLHHISDNTLGHMYTGWHWIPDEDGKHRCYYFETESNGFCGRLYQNTITPDGYKVNENGQWVTEQGVMTKQ